MPEFVRRTTTVLAINGRHRGSRMGPSLGVVCLSAMFILLLSIGANAEPPVGQNSDPLLVAGNLLAASPGADISVMLTPAMHLVDEAPPGTSFQLLTVGSQQIGVDGAFSFRLRYSDVPSEYREVGGLISALVYADTGSAQRNYRFSAELPVGADAWTVYDPEILDNTLILDMNTGAINSAFDPAMFTSDTDSIETVAEVTARNCVVRYHSSLHGPYDVKLADTRGIDDRQMRVKFSNETNSGVTMGIAYKKGSTASWESSGSLTRSTGVSWQSELLKQRRAYVRWYYRDWDLICPHQSTRTFAEPWSYHSRGPTNYLSSVSYSHCSNTYGAGANWERKEARAASFTSGVKVYGVSLGSQSGWDRGVTLRVEFARRGKICGNTNKAELAPKVAAAAA